MSNFLVINYIIYCVLKYNKFDNENEMKIFRLCLDVKKKKLKVMMPFFQSELGWSVFGSLGRTWVVAGQVRKLWMWLFPAKRTRNKKGLARVSPVVATMPKSVSL